MADEVVPDLDHKVTALQEAIATIPRDAREGQVKSGFISGFIGALIADRDE